jgi:PAS domain S-box-containing protein
MKLVLLQPLFHAINTLLDMTKAATMLDPSSKCSGNAEEYASEEEARLIRYAIQDFNSLFFLMRPDSSFMYVNDTTCRVLGYSKEELLTMRVPDVDPGYPQEHWQQLWEAIQQHDAVTIKSRLLTKNNDMVPVEIRLHKQVFNGKEFCTAFAEDITWRLESEEELKEARDAALEATRLKSEFLANMSHEIRTPMNGMLGMARLLMQTPLNNRQREFTQQIIESGEQLTEIIGEILDFSKIESGKLELNEAPLDAIDLVEKVVSLFSNQTSEKVELSFLTPPHIPYCIGDPLRLRQVLSNLVNNAIKFTPSGSVEVTVDIKSESASDINLDFNVKDTGIGITPNALKAIFQPFIQADGSVARKYGGTGLGLPISQQLLQMMGSKLEAKSQPGEGTTMSFSIQLQKLQPAVPEKDNLQLKNITPITLAECHSHVRENIEQQLNYFAVPHQTVCLSNLVENKLEPVTPIFLDTQQWLAHSKDWPTMAQQWRIILLTSGEPQTEIPGTEYIERFVRKPLTRNRLKQLLMEMDSGHINHSIHTTDRAEISAATNLGLSILVVEDNKINYQLINYILESVGCSTTVVTNGLEALNELGKQSFDAILMDCHLPEMDGFAATREIRKKEKEGQHIPIIAVSADATAETRKRCLDSGMDDYASKPIMSDKLLELLSKWTKQEKISTKEKKPEPKAHMIGMDIKIIEALQSMESPQGSLLKTFTLNLAKEIPSSIKQLTESIQSKAFSETADLVHQLKGSCAVVGALDAQRLCEKLRESAQRKNQHDCYSDLLELEKEAERAVEALRNYLNPY